MTHKGTKRIETPRLILRMAQIEDAEPMFRNWASDPKVTKFLTYAKQSEMFVEETFHGSLPAFLAAFGSRKKLSDSEIDELQKVIDAMRG